MTKKKATLNLDDAIEQGKDVAVLDEPESITDKNSNTTPKRVKKKQVPMYLDPNLHDALQTICFAERHNKISMQDIVLEGLSLLFKKRGYPSIKQIINGEKTLNL